MKGINGLSDVSGQTGQLGAAKATDAVSRNIQKQITNLQKQLQELSSNEEISTEEKMKKRQEIQKQIADLNIQLRQHEIELRKEMQQEKENSGNDILGGTGKAGNKKMDNQGAALSQASMQVVISAETAMSQAKVQGSVAAKNEGRAGVLKAEIKQDAAVGSKAKEEELAETEQIAMQASASQAKTLAKANKELEEAAKEEKTDKEKTDEEKIDNDKSDQENPVNAQSIIGYSPIDIRL